MNFARIATKTSIGSDNSPYTLVNTCFLPVNNSIWLSNKCAIVRLQDITALEERRQEKKDQQPSLKL